MADPFVAEIRMFAGNFAPKGWAQCNGQLLPISQNTSLFSLLGTNYGGDGRSNFALPNLQGSVPVAWGQSSTGTTYDLGQQGGSPAITLQQNEIPLHTHTLSAYTDDLATVPTPSPTQVLGRAQGGGVPYRPDQNTTLNPQALSVAGSSQPHNTMMPFNVVNYIIAMQGVFPSRP